MCTGLELLTIASVGASLAGTGAQMKASADERSKMTEVVRRQIQDQNERSKKGGTLLQSSIDQSTPKAAKSQVDQGALNAESLYSQLQGVPLSASQPITGGTNNNAVESASQGGNAYARLIAAPAAQLQGLSSFQMNQLIKNMQTNTQLGVNNFLSQNSASTLPSLLNAAQNSQAGLAGIGSLLGTAGQLGGMYGASQGAFRAPSNVTPMFSKPIDAGAGYGSQFSGYA